MNTPNGGFSAALRLVAARAWTLKHASAEPPAGVNIWPTMRSVHTHDSTLSKPDRTRYAHLAGRPSRHQRFCAGLVSTPSIEQGGRVPCWY